LLPADATVDEHHLVPKSKGGREKFKIHRICHTKIHATISEADLARRFNTWSALRAHPEIATFIDWVQSKPPSFISPNRRPKRRT
jgi:hypothetical protein